MAPTQITAGMWEVDQKREMLRDYAKNPGELKKFIEKHPIRVVLGPENKAYIVDRHHLALAMVLEKFETAPIEIYKDFTNNSPATFWRKMQELQYVHLKDENGAPQPISALPATLLDLKDDPYRSIAAAVRNKGGFEKVKTPYAEFQWADYFRTLIKPEDVSADFDGAVDTAMKAARKPAASQLPGFVPNTPSMNPPNKP